MIVDLGNLQSFASDFALAGLFVFLRVGAAMAVLPVVGEKSVPQRVRLAIALVYTLIVSSAVQPVISDLQLSRSGLAAAIASEVVVGLAMGIGLRMFVFGLQIASSIAAQSTSLSQVFGGAGFDPQPAIGHLLLVAGLALAVTYGLHVQIAEFLIFTYQVIPPGFQNLETELPNWGVEQISAAFGLAFSIAAPFILASLIYNIALGAINKAMPQLMVSFVGAPAVTAGGLILLLVCAPIMLTVWHRAMIGFLESPFLVPR